MNASQISLYWREWGAVSRRCKAEGWAVPERHALHIKALGRQRSHKDFSNAEFDKVLSVFRSYSRPDDLRSQVRQERQPRIRLEHKITVEQAALLAAVLPGREQQVLADGHGGEAATLLDRHLAAEAYIAGIMRERFGTDDIRQISDVPVIRKGDWEKSDLELLRDTLSSRINALRKKKGLTIRAMYQLAGLAGVEGANQNAETLKTETLKEDEVAA